MTPEHFFIIGGQRCGTTYLYQILDEHPEIQMAKPMRPEPKFFLSDAGTKVDYPSYFDSFFQKSEDIRIYGEKSTSYIEHESSAQRILSWFPKGKILVILRNPVDRAISNFHFSKKYGIESRTMEEVFFEKQPPPRIDPAKFSVNPFHYYERGIYHQYLKRWMALFPETSIKVMIFEQFIGQQDKVSELYKWLSVDKTFRPPSLSKQINSAEMETAENQKVTNALATRYIYHNQQLGQLLDCDLSFWNKYL